MRRLTHFSKSKFLPAIVLTAASLATDAAADTTADALVKVASFFSAANVVSGPEIVDCTLSGGTETTCFSITVKPEPQDYTPGPWCPTNTSDTAEEGGIWLKDGEAYDVDGDFITKLGELYGDSDWQLFDPDTGDIRYTGTLESCEAAARPDVDPEYQNYCVQCLPEYMPEEASVTYVIPLDPQDLASSAETNRTGSGLAYNGVRLDGPAPLDAITAAHTIAPFDDCGGHVNTHVGYHYHAVTDCLEDAPATLGPKSGAVEGDAAIAHGSQIGIAMDGYQIFGNLMASGEAPEDLDACKGHAADGVPYHYHAGETGSNAILGCLKAEAGCTLDSPDGTCDASARPKRP